jgi:hypothetical protein
LQLRDPVVDLSSPGIIACVPLAVIPSAESEMHGGMLSISLFLISDQFILNHQGDVGG